MAPLSTEQIQLMALELAISRLSDQERERIRQCAEQIRLLAAAHGHMGSVALALVGAQLAAHGPPLTREPTG